MYYTNQPLSELVTLYAVFMQNLLVSLPDDLFKRNSLWIVIGKALTNKPCSGPDES